MTIKTLANSILPLWIIAAASIACLFSVIKGRNLEPEPAYGYRVIRMIGAAGAEGRPSGPRFDATNALDDAIGSGFVIWKIEYLGKPELDDRLVYLRRPLGVIEKYRQPTF